MFDNFIFSVVNENCRGAVVQRALPICLGVANLSMARAFNLLSESESVSHPQKPTAGVSLSEGTSSSVGAVRADAAAAAGPPDDRHATSLRLPVPVAVPVAGSGLQRMNA